MPVYMLIVMLKPMLELSSEILTYLYIGTSDLCVPNATGLIRRG